MNFTCPKNPKHDTFITKQRLLQEIEMDNEGNYQSTHNDSEVIETHYEDAVCSTCGTPALDTEE